eukprot:TRINITY_DN60593_c0_g1_i1.p2 TRINITY_DN60593_c0_g1~~TRINITY_DN60593_c0_g1_i1.p2  ORF type:complete len:125 (-),score=21.81 TRINITY_DN60593_c0_g1_i1:94-468(-)
MSALARCASVSTIRLSADALCLSVVRMKPIGRRGSGTSKVVLRSGVARKSGTPKASVLFPAGALLCLIRSAIDGARPRAGSCTNSRCCVVSGRVVVPCLLYTSDAADEEDSVDLGGRRIIKKKN